MTLAYPLRLLCLSVAVFFLVHLAAGAVVSLWAPAAVGFAERMKARTATRFLLSLRFAPLVCAVVVVVGLCVPSFLLLEPEAGAEEVGFACLAAAAAGVSITVLACRRLVTTVVRSCAWIAEEHTAVLALAGILRPQVLVSADVLEALNPEELDAALRHEGSHQRSHDNLKRLCIVAAPGILPFCYGFRRIEEAWARFSEWAADDEAAAGDALVSTALAGALVQVARITPRRHVAFLVTTLIDDQRGLAERVERLLNGTATENWRRCRVAAWTGAVLACVACIAAVRPGTLTAVHSLLEQLMR